MKKIVGLCLVVLLSSMSVFAQDGQRRGQRENMDPSERIEKMVKDLNLTDDQAVNFRAAEMEHHEKMKTNRENMQNKTAEERRAEMDKRREEMDKMRDDKNARMKEILNEDQYKKYLENQESPRNGERGPRDRQRNDNKKK